MHKKHAHIQIHIKKKMLKIDAVLSVVSQVKNLETYSKMQSTSYSWCLNLAKQHFLFSKKDTKIS